MRERTFGSQELGLGSGILGVYQTSGVDLDLVHVNAIGTDLHEHLVSITSGVSTVGGGEIVGVWPPLLEKGVFCEVGSVTTSGQDDGTVERSLLAVEGICDTGSAVALGVDLGDLGLLDQLDTVGLLLGKLFESLHQSICDGHTGELCVVTTVGSGLGVTTGELVSMCMPELECQGKTYPKRETRVRSRLKTSISHSTAAADL